MHGGGSRVVQGRLDQWWSGGGLVAWFRGGFVVVRGGSAVVRGGSAVVRGGSMVVWGWLGDGLGWLGCSSGVARR
jgi:hypothetical protein